MGVISRGLHLLIEIRCKKITCFFKGKRLIVTFQLLIVKHRKQILKTQTIQKVNEPVNKTKGINFIDNKKKMNSKTMRYFHQLNF